MGSQEVASQYIPQGRWEQDVFGQSMADDCTAALIEIEVTHRLPADFESRTYTYEELKLITQFAANVGLRFAGQPTLPEHKVQFAAEVVKGESFFQGSTNPTSLLNTSAEVSNG